MVPLPGVDDAALNVVDAPVQKVAIPVIEAIGFSLTVTTVASETAEGHPSGEV